MKKVMVTGCLGLIGYYLTKKLLENKYEVIGVDCYTYAAKCNIINELQQFKNFTFLNLDINKISSLFNCDVIFNLAAETHVDHSIENITPFIDTNIFGVKNILNLINQSKIKPILFHFSTDEVYGDVSTIDNEKDEACILSPGNPYAATKACSDMLILSYNKTFGIEYYIVRPTNNYGIGQYPIKLIPRIIKSFKYNIKVPMHNFGQPKRVWLSCKDTVDAALFILNNCPKNQIYNIAGNTVLKNIEVFEKIKNIFNNKSNNEDFIDFSLNRPGQDFCYSINDKKLKSYGWNNKINFDNEIEEIINFHKNNFITFYDGEKY